jgi:hypothetical protein
MFGVPFNVDDQIIQSLEPQGFFLFLGQLHNVWQTLCNYPKNRKNLEILMTELSDRQH